MMKWERTTYCPREWDAILALSSDSCVYQTSAWMAFLADAQHGEVVHAVLRDANATRGYFVGLLVRKCGLRLLGSPLPGWTTSYMGMNLAEGVPRWEAFGALRDFAFRELACVHLEMMDRQLAGADLAGGIVARSYSGSQVDLSASEDELFGRMDPACRRCIRKATRCGVTIEVAADEQFATDYYAQLRDVFAKQGLVPTYGVGRVRQLIRHLLPTGNLLLLRARDSQGQAIATGVFPGAFSRAFFWGGASWRSHQILRPNELLMWNAMLYWKRRGIRFFDLGGGGEYKRKYGGAEVTVPWLRVSRYPLLPALRNAAAAAVRLRQVVHGRFSGIAAGSPSTANSC